MSVARAKAAQLSKQGLKYYNNWDIERAVESFKAAITLHKNNGDYHLYLAQCYARLGDYEAMRKSLGRFLHLESDPDLVDRYEHLFGNALDDVEQILTQVMTQHTVPIGVVGAAMQVWFDFKIAMGRQAINLGGAKPRAWAASLDYTVRKINFYDVTAEELSAWYDISPEAVMQQHGQIIDMLDIMPCDYRYFRGKENPLDKLVEAAILLEDLEARFHQH